MKLIRWLADAWAWLVGPHPELVQPDPEPAVLPFAGVVPVRGTVLHPELGDTEVRLPVRCHVPGVGSVLATARLDPAAAAHLGWELAALADRAARTRGARDWPAAPSPN